MNIVELPLTPRLQKSTFTLNGVNYVFQVRWNPYGYWVVDIFNSDNTALLTGIPLVTGTNLLDQFDYLDIGLNANMLIVTLAVDRLADDNPTISGLGTESKLYYVLP